MFWANIIINLKLKLTSLQEAYKDSLGLLSSKIVVIMDYKCKIFFKITNMWETVRDRVISIKF